MLMEGRVKLGKSQGILCQEFGRHQLGIGCLILGSDKVILVNFPEYLVL